jgi:predicted DCC family thiol-disulfide oxidoreductase YuxK
VAPRLTVLYDADCGICIATGRQLRRWDRDGRLDVRPLQGAARSDDPLVAQAAASRPLDEALHVIDRGSGRVLAGGDAVLAIVGELPGGDVFAPFAGWPHVRWLADRSYAWVAANRRSISRWLDLDRLCEGPTNRLAERRGDRRPMRVGRPAGDPVVGQTLASILGRFGTPPNAHGSEPCRV